MMTWMVVPALADEPETPAPEVSVPAEPAPDVPRSKLRTTNSGLGVGVLQFGALGSQGSAQLYGADLDLRAETVLSRSTQLDFTLAVGVTHFETTAALVDFGIDVGQWTTTAFGNVTDWALNGPDDGLESFRVLGAILAYSGLTLCYLAVPVIWAISPFAAVGDVLVGPSVSWHTSDRAPNLYVEGGIGATMYGHPVTGDAETGVGPMVSVGSQVAKESVSLRVWVSPPGFHTVTDGDTILSGAVVLGL